MNTILLLILSSFIVLNNATKLNVNAWQNFGHQFETYPEAPYLKGKSNSGITFSGGGTRSYAATLGYLRGLYDLGLLDRTRYISAVSGGSWASTAFTFHQLDDDRTFLGHLVPPEQLNWINLFRSNAQCARSFPVRQNLLLKCLKLLLVGDISTNWFDAISETFLEPAGIPRRGIYSWNNATLSDMIARNPSIAKESHLLACKGTEVCKNRPYLIVNSAMLGPSYDSPFGTTNRSFTMLEWTPLYVGTGTTLDIVYLPSKTNLTVGGYIEPIGFGTGPFASKHEHHWIPPISRSLEQSIVSPRVKHENVSTNIFRRMKESTVVATETSTSSQTIKSKNSYTKITKPTKMNPSIPNTLNDTFGRLHVDQPFRFYELANVTGSSSWAPGGLFADTPILDFLDAFLGLEVPYKSPAQQKQSFDTVKTTNMLLADAGSLENHGLIALLRRKVDSAVVFVNTMVPLVPHSKYNPFDRLPTATDIDDSVPCFFGIRVKDTIVQTLGSDFSRDQVFKKEDFPHVMHALQLAQAAGKGAIATVQLETVQNDWWGIPAGHKVKVTWVYLGRAFEWENRLRPHLRSQVVPKHGENDPTKVPQGGRFENFPHFGTSEVHLTTAQVNLLSNLAGWTVLDNASIFRDALE